MSKYRYFKLDYIIKLTIYDISVGLEKKNYTKVLNLPVNVKKKIQQKWTIWSLDN